MVDLVVNISMKEQRLIGEIANIKLLVEWFGNQSGYLTKHWRIPT
jgi:hypothetical protein